MSDNLNTSTGPRLPEYDLNVDELHTRVRAYSSSASPEANQLMSVFAMEAYCRVGSQGLLHSSGWPALKCKFETLLMEAICQGLLVWYGSELHVDINNLLDSPDHDWLR